MRRDGAGETVVYLDRALENSIHSPKYGAPVPQWNSHLSHRSLRTRLQHSPILVATMSMMRSVALVVVISLVSGGCTSYKTTALENPTPTAASLNVKQGDTVRVTL